MNPLLDADEHGAQALPINLANLIAIARIGARHVVG